MVVKGKQKCRLCIDYSQIINQYTEENAYPIPRIDEIVNQLAHYKYFSKYDLKSAYYQVPIKAEDKKFTAFEANGRLYQFTRIPFGVKNGVGAFQRAMMKMVDEENSIQTYPYLDDVTVAGNTQEELNKNDKQFEEVCKRRNITLNEDKTTQQVSELKILGYQIKDGQISPNSDRLKSLLEMQPPANMKDIHRVRGLFTYYAKWIPNFSAMIKPLSEATFFPLASTWIEALYHLKRELGSVTLMAIDEGRPFVVETDASDTAISATLNQAGNPVAFFSKSLQNFQKGYPAVEKEAMAVVEAVQYWSHLLARRKFTLITDQRSVAYMYSSKI